MSTLTKPLQTAAFLWLLVVTALALLAFRQGPSFDSSIMSLLPTSNQQPVVQQATDKMAARFSKRLIILLTGESEDSVRISIESLASALAAMPEVADITWQVKEKELNRYREELFPYRFALLDNNLRATLQTGNDQQIKENAVRQLFSPLPSGEHDLISDPFNLFNMRALNRTTPLNIQILNGLLKVTPVKLENADVSTRDSHPVTHTKPDISYMLMITLAGEVYSPALQQNILGYLAHKTDELASSGIQLEMSGMLLHAAAGAKQASKEISTIGVGSILGIIIIMILVFRQFKPLLLMMFPVVIGCLTAASVTQLLFEKVHLITLAFGAGLVGVSIDYALHFLCERKNTTAEKILPKILPGLLLGLFSSVLAYAAQALAPFPGLQQMATFSVVGLIASWLTVVLWFPILTRKDSIQPLPLARSLDLLRKRFPRFEKSPVLISAVVLALLLSAITLRGGQAQDDIRLLQTSPASLLKQEMSVRKALGISSSSQFLLITAATLEQCLQTEERLVSRLEKLQLKHFQRLSLELPSLQRQAENTALVKHLYDTQLNTFYDVLTLPDNKRDQAWSELKEGLSQRLTPELWKQQSSSASSLDFIVQSSAPAATIIRFTDSLNPEVEHALIALSENEPGVYYVNQIENISTLMGNYRSQVINWVLLAYLGVLVVLLFRYKRQVWRIVLPPLLASIFTLAILVQLEDGVNLFHLMALILVLGIGLDMGIFLSETQDAAHTWLAVSLSTLTSLLAFGLLALSKTPVLHHFGLAVLLGLTWVWLLAPLMRKGYSGDTQI